jgi:hypothetical protein
VCRSRGFQGAAPPASRRYRSPTPPRGLGTVSTFEEQTTALAWRDQLRGMGLDASYTADHPLDRFGRGDIYLVVPRQQWSRANEIIENLL